jgi:hypothetical protein
VTPNQGWDCSYGVRGSLPGAALTTGTGPDDLIVWGEPTGVAAGAPRAQPTCRVRRAVPRLSARCPPRNPAAATTAFPARPSTAPAAYLPRSRAASEPTRRKVATSVPTACTAPIRRSAPDISAQSPAPAMAVGPAAARPAPTRSVAARRPSAPPARSRRDALVQHPSVRSVSNGCNEWPRASVCAAPRPVDHRSIDEVLRTIGPVEDPVPARSACPSRCETTEAIVGRAQRTRPRFILRRGDRPAELN